MSSDNIPLFGYTSNINALTSVYTEKVLNGQYISLSLIGASDQNLTIIFQFSGNGVNWDYSVSKSLPIGSNTQISTPVLAKWTRLEILNTGVVNTTYVRLFVYGTPSNSSIVAQIGKIGNIWPSINIANLQKTAFGDLISVEPQPESQYIWTYGTNGNLLTRSYATPYSTELTSWSTAFDTGVGATIQFTNGICKFGNGAIPASRALFAGRTFRYRSGQGFSSRFTAYFTQGLKSILGNFPTTEYVGIGNWNTTTYRPQNGYFFGYGDPTLVGTSQLTNFGIVWINDGVRVFYPRTAWNVDRCDGTYIMPVIDFNLMNVFQISFQFLGFGVVSFYVENPTDGEFYLVHTINRVNTVITPANLRDPSLAFLMYVEVEAAVVPVTLTDEVGSTSGVTFIQGKSLEPIQRVSVNSSKTAIAAETSIINLRCDSTFYGRDNWYSLMFDFFSFSVDGTKNSIIKVYRNSTIGGAPVWTTPQPNIIPVSFDVAGTFGVGGTNILTYTLGKTDQVEQILEDLRVYLLPGQTFTITCQSTANTDVFVAASCHIY